ncbi:hypothetical protein BU100_07105 [Staphylococcus xylosus]|uniref:hypothetical protein n=1 Tax=Staphylococcus xylosus TaxID=1288 RepID=UPI000E67F28C|nr:hypothetical protein [Staphylococcus xylosus]RIM94764.1 hypothetical protein BU100_07105 [Staphylococcus xylosus]
MSCRIIKQNILEKYEDMKKQRNSLIEDTVLLRANISRLERENEKQLDVLQDFSKFINYKLEVSPASDTYKRYRSELDKLGVK